MTDQTADFRDMTTDTVGRDILQALVQEIKLLPDVWVKISKSKQDDVIDRLRSRVETNIKMAVHLLAAEGRTVVAGDLDQITIKDGVKAVVKFSSVAANLHELYEASGMAVLVVVANPKENLVGMDEVRGESDQRGIDLGHEYDPSGDGKGMPGEGGDVVDAEFIQIEHQPLTRDLQRAWDAGYDAAEAGEPQSACPLMTGALCIEWVKGWKTYHDEKDIPDLVAKPDVATKKLGEIPNESGVYTCEPDEVIGWGDKKNNVAIELLELQDGNWLYATNINIGTTHNSGPLCIRHGMAISRVEALIAVRNQLTQIYSVGELCGLKGKQFIDFTKFVNFLVEDNAEGEDA